MRILSIESTCDETGVALVENCGDGVKVIRNLVASSAEIHQKYGGIIPEIAAREQIMSIVPLLKEIGVKKNDIDAIAVSYGPGLMGSLLVGVETAKTLSWMWGKPILKVNHLVAHILANWIIEGSVDDEYLLPTLPAVGLVISGGHTDLILMKSLSEWEWIGGTRDDAVGEAFDKAARILGLPYPGGPEIDKAANKIEDGDWRRMDNKYRLPRPMLREHNLEMSFSGVKAALARITDGPKELLAKEFSEAVYEILEVKVLKAVEKYRPKSIIVAGGVAANSRIREGLRDSVEATGSKLFVPELKYCGDNAAMVGAAAILRPTEGSLDLKPEPSLGVV